MWRPNFADESDSTRQRQIVDRNQSPLAILSPPQEQEEEEEEEEQIAEQLEPNPSILLQNVERRQSRSAVASVQQSKAPAEEHSEERFDDDAEFLLGVQPNVVVAAAAAGDDVLDDSGIDVEGCRFTGERLANDIKEKLEYMLQFGDARAEEQQDWLFEDVYGSSLRQYVHGTVRNEDLFFLVVNMTRQVSRISDIISRFVQKASALVDSEGACFTSGPVDVVEKSLGLKAAALIRRLRTDLPEDVLDP